MNCEITWFNFFKNHQFAQNDIQLITEKIDDILRDWKYKIDAQKRP